MSQPASARPSGGGGNGRSGREPYDLDAVLDIAVAAFNDFGYDATSMGLLAERLGTSKSAVYYHVSGKEDLLRLALDRALGKLENVLVLDGATTGSAADRLRFVVRAAVGVLVEDLPYVTLLLRVRGNTEVERDALQRRRAFDHQVALLVDEAVAAGRCARTSTPARVTRLLFGMVNSIVEWYKPGRA